MKNRSYMKPNPTPSVSNQILRCEEQEDQKSAQSEKKQSGNRNLKKGQRLISQQLSGIIMQNDREGFYASVEKELVKLDFLRNDALLHSVFSVSSDEAVFHR
ncbi:hypothetical protein P3S68_015029 [Capsicum galapagoense]